MRNRLGFFSFILISLKFIPFCISLAAASSLDFSALEKGNFPYKKSRLKTGFFVDFFQTAWNEFRVLEGNLF
ncbi:hypothetical protein DLM77_10475 [Leptospira yasudae]|uniref:Uncharacterized protein n=1 Tax=Leptospira yasudae TaxID=2202201 RepID=A0ABX9M3R5_9LEPT|nr:hypothetical protein DLM77_10475 [Leptospira yasudae]